VEEYSRKQKGIAAKKNHKGGRNGILKRHLTNDGRRRVKRKDGTYQLDVF